MCLKSAFYQSDLHSVFWPIAGSINPTAEEIEEKWQSLTADLSALLQGRAGEISECTIPFDAASEIPVDEQR